MDPASYETTVDAMDGVIIDHDLKPTLRLDAYTAAHNFLHTLRWARNDDEELRSFVEAEPCGETTAEVILGNVSRTVLQGNTCGDVAGDVFVGIINRSVALTCEVFDEKKHAEMVTVVALGMLVVVAPWVVEALGFGPVGPNPGTWAGKWQDRYSEYVPKGSLFTFFKRLDMEWS